MTIGFQGVRGAFSDAAIRRIRPAAATKGYESFDLLVAAVAAGDVEAALLPVENTIFGSIARAYDLLWDYPQLHAIAETAYPVDMQLIGATGATEASVLEIRSHPVALEQIHRYANRFPHWKRTAVADTAGAVAEIVALGDPTVAAIGPALAAELYGGVILASRIQDDARNFTRFYLIAMESEHETGPLACVAIEVAHRPGALRNALSALADRAVDVRNLVARPNHVDPFHYRFFLEVATSEPRQLDEALRAMDGTVRVIGRFAHEPAAG